MGIELLRTREQRVNKSCRRLNFRLPHILWFYTRIARCVLGWHTAEAEAAHMCHRHSDYITYGMQKDMWIWGRMEWGGGGSWDMAHGWILSGRNFELKKFICLKIGRDNKFRVAKVDTKILQPFILRLRFGREGFFNLTIVIFLHVFIVVGMAYVI